MAAGAAAALMALRLQQNSLALSSLQRPNWGPPPTSKLGVGEMLQQQQECKCMTSALVQNTS